MYCIQHIKVDSGQYLRYAVEDDDPHKFAPAIDHGLRRCQRHGWAGSDRAEKGQPHAGNAGLTLHSYVETIRNSGAREGGRGRGGVVASVP